MPSNLIFLKEVNINKMRSKAKFVTTRSSCSRNYLPGFKDLDGKIDEKYYFGNIKSKRNSKANQMKANIVHYKKRTQKEPIKVCYTYTDI